MHPRNGIIFAGIQADELGRMNEREEFSCGKSMLSTSPEPQIVEEERQIKTTRDGETIMHGQIPVRLDFRAASHLSPDKGSKDTGRANRRQHG